MQRILLIYDIVEDRARAKAANACLDYGLDRIQYSAFMGHLSRNHQQELIMRILHGLRDSAGKVQIIPINEKDWDKRLEVEHG